jgi:hypothetical protein
MASPYYISSQVGQATSTQYWTVDATGIVQLTSSQAGASTQGWSVESGVLYNLGKQVYYDMDKQRFTTSNPISATARVTTVTMVPSTNPLVNWNANITSMYPVNNQTMTPATFSGTIGNKTTYTLPVQTLVSNAITYPILGGASSAAPTAFINTIQAQLGGSLVTVPLSGFVALPDQGEIAPGSQVVVPVIMTPTTLGWSTGWVIAFAVAILIIVLLVGWVLFSKKKETIPLLQEPAVQMALVRRK